MSDVYTPTPDDEVGGTSAPADTPHLTPDQPDAHTDEPVVEGDSQETGDSFDAEHQAGDATDVEDDAEETNPVAALEEEVAALRDQVMRARADYDNLNKRRLREVSEARDRGAANLAGALVDVLDSFEMALGAASQSADTQLAKGVQLVHDQLMNALRQSGMEAVPGVGSPFDPNHHEAVHAEEDDQDRDTPEVIDVLRTGWTYKGQLLRAATVRVVN